jgi:hypothetical protein
MAIVLRKPGSIFEEEIPELGIKIYCKALDAEHGCEVQKLATQFILFVRGEAKNFDLVDYFETVIGYCAEKIEGVEYEGAPFELEKTPSGKLTDECLSILNPIVPQVADFLLGKLSLKKEDIKNS